MSETRQYEFLLVLDARGAEEAKAIIERLTKQFEAEGTKVLSVQNMDRREFSYVAGKLSAGVYVNFVVEAAASAVDTLQSKFKLDKDIYRQSCHRVATPKAAAGSA